MQEYENDADKEPSKTRRVSLAVVWFFGVVSVYSFWPLCSVPAGSRGVVTNFGRPEETVRTEGIHFVMPIAEHMHIIPTSIQKSEDKGEAASKDLQTVETTITLNYHILPADVVTVYTELGEDYEENIVRPAVQESVKAVTANFTAEELISKREMVRNDIMADLTDKLKRHGMIIDEMSITDFNFSKSFNDAIEAKTTAEQLKLKADRDLERIRVEANQRAVQADGEARALAAQKQQITPELLQLQAIQNEKAAIDKWNGTLPQYVTGTAPMPFIGSLGQKN